MSNLPGSRIDEQATVHPGILETALASLALFVMRLMRPKLALNHVRLEWFCTCGVQMYADYPDSGDIAEFQESLGDTRERPPSFAHMIGVGGRSKLFRTVVLCISAVLTWALITWLINATAATLRVTLGLLGAFAVAVVLAIVTALLRVGELNTVLSPSRSLRVAS